MKILYKIIGLSNTPVSHIEKIISAIGGFLAILSILIISQWLVGAYAAAIIVASMGASAVLLFAVPHGPLSQPWPVLGGHVISALIGITCAQFISNEIFAASLAVGIAIAAMYYLQCIHPPGGATALSAVMGGESIHALGYQYAVTPVLLNVLIILFFGVLFNAFFHWRRYPAFWFDKKTEKEASNKVRANITHEDFVYALTEIDSFIDVNEQDLLHIYELVMGKPQAHALKPENLFVGGYYSNGQYGNDWAVRQIVDSPENKRQADDIVIYKIVAGHGRRSSAYSSRNDFLRWAKHQVIREEDNWKRIDGSHSI
ncbi:HPP family protein [Candidatus Venteria ishoeyi]|uniref:HPP family protein n=1 Tax=Candidatus Venteria ishoeyi TaxID=1899563 RepID=A0A1H6FFZ8_9GAMM|nr:HPP family protein [Candidatus Venteria ishoeyi]MDM8545300.1 HPP family protein [Candidatus Venteria ishoeyi]SEH07934.1 HPP family protein [Candidatus Venteria ishoeyi]